jgi:putative mRNA 3-end processing factor
MISFDGIFSLKSEDLGLHKPSEHMTLVSHGHSDHLPGRYVNNSIVCSDITKKMIELRKNKNNLDIHNDKKIELLNSGHTLGSNMFLINKETLYTGDFNTEPRYCGSAVPKKCKTLLIETTYGKPKYIFPKTKHVLDEFRDYLKENEMTTIKAYSFGKAQEICHVLDKWKIPFAVNYKIEKINEHLGLKFKYFDRTAPVILTDEHHPGYKRIALSGWAFEHYFERMMKLDKSFLLSDHCDYPSLVEFVKKCNPEKIYTYHGFNVEFALDLRKAGFDAQPILKGQKLLTDFN